MSDAEYDVLDELYFVRPFAALHQTLAWPEEQLKEELRRLYAKGWVQLFHPGTDNLVSENPDWNGGYRDYAYLATKAGLLALHRR